jgi:hypothetical protein
MAAKVTWDTSSKIIRVNNGITELDVQIDLYSDGKEDWLIDLTLSQFEFPFRTVGGDPLTATQSIGPKFFLKSPWVIKPYEGDHELLLTGDLYSNETPPSGLVIPTSGTYTVNVIFNRSFDAITTVVETSGVVQPGTQGMVASFIR